MTHERRNFWILWSGVSIASFLAFFIGVKYILNSAVITQNVVAYLVVSFIFGAVCSTLYLLRLKIAASSFLAGVAVGFFEMFRAFFSDLSGWEDLAGLMSLFLWMGAGLTVGALAEIIRYFFFKASVKK